MKILKIMCIVIMFVWVGYAFSAQLTSHTTALLDALLLAIDTDFDGAIDDEAWLDAKLDASTAATTYESISPSTQTIEEASEGTDSTPGTYSLTPTAGKKLHYIRLSTLDPDGETITVLETGAAEGNKVTIKNAGGYNLFFPWVSAQLEFTGGSAGKIITLEPGQHLTIDYGTDRWGVSANESSTVFIRSISVPSYAHFASADAAYSDTSTPHVLVAAETHNGIITNCGATEDRVYTLHAYDFGMNFMVMVCAAYQMDLEPVSGGAIWLNGTAAAADEHIINAADTKGEVMSCWSVETANGTYEVFCESKYATWAEATP